MGPAKKTFAVAAFDVDSFPTSSQPKFDAGVLSQDCTSLTVELVEPIVTVPRGVVGIDATTALKSPPAVVHGEPGHER